MQPSTTYVFLVYAGFVWLNTLAFHSPSHIAVARPLQFGKAASSTFLLRSPPRLRMVSPTDDSSNTSSPSPARADDNNNNDLGVLRTIFHGIGSTTSVVVSGTFFGALAYKRDALMVSFFIGSIGNAITGKILKRILNQERPAELEVADMKLKPGDKGMPSSHAMSLGFIGTFAGLTLPSWTRGPILLYSLISLTYRIDIKLHTWQQIVVGFVVGSTNGAIWHHLCHGNNPFGIHVINLISQSSGLLNEDGLLPLTMLAVPAVVGAFVVGSVERRLAGWLKKIKSE